MSPVITDIFTKMTSQSKNPILEQQEIDCAKSQIMQAIAQQQYGLQNQGLQSASATQQLYAQQANQPYLGPLGGGAAGAAGTGPIYPNTYPVGVVNTTTLPTTSCPPAAIITINFTDAGDVNHVINVAAVHAELFRNISRQYAQRLYGARPAPPKSDSDFSEDEMTLAENIIKEMEPLHGS